MKAKDAAISWVTEFENGPRGGKVEVHEIFEAQDWSGLDTQWFGKGEKIWREANWPNARLVLLFRLFVLLTARFKFDPIVVHNAFCQIDEYKSLVDASLRSPLAIVKESE